MRQIDRGAEPADCPLRDVRRDGPATTAAAWDRMSAGKSTLRSQLLKRQGHLCAYCMTRLRDVGYSVDAAAVGGTKIEHHTERAVAPARMFDWDNVLAVCGGEKPEPHCDGARSDGDPPLPIDPARRPPDITQLFRYPAHADGLDVDVDEHHASATDGRAMITALCLNITLLRRNRAAALEEATKALWTGKRQATDGELLALYRRATIIDDEGKLPPYADVVAKAVYKWLRKRGIEP